MNHSLLVSLKREDFGFAVARALAVIIWILALRNLDKALQLTVGHWWSYGFGYAARSSLGNGPSLAYVLILTYIGFRLWRDASRFGASSGQAASDDAVVMASRSLLVSGVAMGVAAYPLVTGSVSLVRWLLFLVQGTGPSRTESGAAGAIVGAVFDVLLGAAVFGWAYSTANKVQVPEFEYTEVDATV